MPVKKLSATDIPSDLLGDLQSLLITKTKEYVAIGQNFYELYPTSAVKLMQVLAEFDSILNEVWQEKTDRIKKNLNEEQLKKFDPIDVVVTVEDLLVNKNFITKVREIMPLIIEGVDEEDKEAMTLGQTVDLVQKVIKVNFETLPPSYRAKVEEVASKFTQDKKENDAAKNP